MRFIYWFAAVFLFVISSISPLFAETTRTYHIGVLANWGEQAALSRWQPLMDYLESQIPNTQFKVMAGSFDELDQALKEDQLQFVITNPGQYLALANQYPLSWLATMRSRQHQGATSAIGSAIVVRADSDYHTLYDLKQKVVVASSPQALGGYQAAVDLLKQFGLTAETWFARIQFLGFPLDPLIYQVRDHYVAAAITPFCTLETMANKGLIELTQFRVLNATKLEGYDCKSSTFLYPNWSFAASEAVSLKLKKQVSDVLLNLPDNHPAAVKGDFAGWAPPISQLAVIQLYDRLKPESRGASEQEPFWQWLQHNQYWGAILIGLFILATAYHFWVEYKLLKKTEVLLNTERQLKQQELALEKLQSSAILGEIGAGLAHELNQPIAAMSSYSEGGLIRAQANGLAHQDYVPVFEKIHQQAQRAGEIVHRIRHLLRRQEIIMGSINPLSLLEDTLALLQLHFQQHHVQFQQRILGEPFFIYGDQTGLLQVLINVLKNSVDAMSAQPNKHIHLEMNFLAEQLIISITDNGTGLTLAPHEALSTFCTTKKQGLGLGLSICHEIIKQHQGQFDIENRPLPAQGCLVRIRLQKRQRD